MTDLIPQFHTNRIVDLVSKAIARIKFYQPEDQPYWVGFSGGKDSIVLKHLMVMADVPAEFHYSVTTLDPPELMKYIKAEHPDVIWDRPKRAFFPEMAKRGLPMRPHSKWCCHEYKESGPNSGDNRVVVLGIRWAESARRRQDRQTVQRCYRNKTKHYLHPILEWTDTDIWEYIKHYNLPYCSLYDEGFKRLGCIGCPFAGQRQRDREFERWPKYTELYKKYINKLYESRVEDGKEWTKLFRDGEHLYLAWRGLVPWPKKFKVDNGLFGDMEG